MNNQVTVYPTLANRMTEEGLKINRTWYPALENCKTKSVTSKNMNTEHDQLDHSLPNAGQSDDSSKQTQLYKARALQTTQQHYRRELVMRNRDGHDMALTIS